MTGTGGALHITTSPSGLQLRGEIDAHSVTGLVSHLDPLPESEGDVVIDLSGVGFIDSSGLHMILKAHARSDADSNRLRIRRGPRRVQRVFELTGTDSRLPFID